MQMTFDLKDDLAQQLKTIPDIDDFVNQVINKALQNRVKTKEQPSKWALLAKEIKNNPNLHLNGYSVQMKKDMCEVRENFVFSSDE